MADYDERMKAARRVVEDAIREYLPAIVYGNLVVKQAVELSAATVLKGLLALGWLQPHTAKRVAEATLTRANPFYGINFRNFALDIRTLMFLTGCEEDDAINCGAGEGDGTGDTIPVLIDKLRTHCERLDDEL
jgi:hypothetical protein